MDTRVQTRTNEQKAWQERIKQVNAHFSTGTTTEWVKPVATGTDSVTPTPACDKPVEIGHFGTMTRKEAQDMLTLAYRDYRDVQGHIDAISYNFGDCGQFLPIRTTLVGMITLLTNALN